MTTRTPRTLSRRLIGLVGALAVLSGLVVAAGAPAGAAPAQAAPTDAPPSSLPPGLPVVDPPADPTQPPPPEPPIPDPSPQVAVVLAQFHILDLQAELGVAQAQADQALATQQRVQAVVDAAQRDRDLKKSALTAAAATAYVRGGVDEVGDDASASAADAFVSSESARMLAGSALDAAHARLVTAEQRLQLAQRMLDDAKQKTAAAVAARDTMQAEIDDANNSLAQLRHARGDQSPSVLGDPTLTADEIVGWYRSQQIVGWAGNVDLPTMVGYYLTEGAAEGVRGDVAFAQSMVETGAFTSPLTGHNNFAGIGACDSCATGFDFPSPQLGVRAQMQLLHAYADKGLTLKALANPAIGSDPDRLSVRGCCETWNRLTGTWASDPNYGPKIMTIYLSMLQFAYAKRVATPPAPLP